MAENKKPRKRNEDDLMVRRGELKEIMGQISANIAEISNYLIEDINALFKNHVYPTMMRQTAMTELLIEKGIITDEELTARVLKLQKDALEKAKKQMEEEKATNEAVAHIEKTEETAGNTSDETTENVAE